MMAHDQTVAAYRDAREQPAVELVDCDGALQLFAEITFEFLLEPRGTNCVPNPPSRGNGSHNHQTGDSERDSSAARLVFVHTRHVGCTESKGRASRAASWQLAALRT